MEMVGQRFGRWIVLSFHSQKAKNKSWLCRCDCGTEKAVGQSHLRSGSSTISCGCFRKERMSALKTTHGMTRNGTRHKGYLSWQQMLSRCRNPNYVDFQHYGGRGIAPCERWVSFDGFWTDMGPSWFLGATLERVDVNGNYEPNNCTWILKKDQARNKRNNVIVQTPWGRMLIMDVVRKTGLDYGTIRRRYRDGRSPEEIVRVGTRFVRPR